MDVFPGIPGPPLRGAGVPFLLVWGGFRAILLLSCTVLWIRSLCWEGAPGTEYCQTLKDKRQNRLVLILAVM